MDPTPTTNPSSTSAPASSSSSSSSPSAAAASRGFSTATRTGPLPIAARGPSFKWAIPMTAVICAGAALSTYRAATAESRSALSAKLDEEERERQRRHEKLMDMYGDRSSIEALERATQFYISSPDSNHGR